MKEAPHQRSSPKSRNRKGWGESCGLWSGRRADISGKRGRQFDSTLPYPQDHAHESPEDHIVSPDSPDIFLPGHLSLARQPRVSTSALGLSFPIRNLTSVRKLTLSRSRGLADSAVFSEPLLCTRLCWKNWEYSRGLGSRDHLAGNALGLDVFMLGTFGRECLDRSPMNPRLASNSVCGRG